MRHLVELFAAPDLEHVACVAGGIYIIPSARALFMANAERGNSGAASSASPFTHAGFAEPRSRAGRACMSKAT